MSEPIFSTGALIVFFMLMLYMVVGVAFEKYKVPIGHESGIAILVGMLISYILLGSYIHLENMLTFDPTLFFYFCLPPIVFASAYNMKRKKFFLNFSNVLMFGLVSTVI